MAGLPWIRVATDFASHPKALALEVRLGDQRAQLHLPAVWGHFARHYADGSMPDTEDAVRALERAALWQGEPGALVNALVEVVLLERKRKRLFVHGWGEWQAAHAAKMERDRDRMRAKRAETRKNSRATVARGSSDGRGGEERERRGDTDPSSLRSEGAATPPAPPLGEVQQHPLLIVDEKAGKPRSPSPYQLVVDHWFTAWERAGRGKHPSLTDAEGKQLKVLIHELEAEEVMARMDRAFSDPCSSSTAIC